MPMLILQISMIESRLDFKVLKDIVFQELLS